MPQLFTNNAATTMSGSLTQGGTTLIVATGEGARFPAPSGGDFCYVTLYEKDVANAEERFEVAKVTARTADTLTIVRDIEGVTGQVGGFAYPSSPGKTVYIELRWSAGAALNMMQKSANLSDLDNAATSRTNLGLGNVDNTSDTAKPISTAQQTELNLKANIASPTFTGTVGGITATMVGLGNVDNTSNATERAATATLTNKTFGNAVTITDNSASPALKVTQTGTGNAFVVEDVASDTTPFVIDANGNVGFGVSTPAKRLDVTALGELRLRTGSVTFDATPTAGANDGLIWNASASTGYYAWQANGVERLRIDSAGRVGIGAAASAAEVDVQKTVSGGTFRAGIASRGQVQSDVTARADMFLAANACAAGTYNQISGYQAQQGTLFGTVATQIGFNADATLVGAASNFGFYSAIPAAANNYNFYAAGTANNYFAGTTGIGLTITEATTNSLQVGGDVLLAGLNRATMHNLYFSGGWKYHGNGYAAVSKSDDTAGGGYTIAVAPLNSSGAGAACVPVNALRVTSTGDVLSVSSTGLLGYGTGAGGTVTQVTSKATTVTLNKPTGQITLNNTAGASGDIAAGATVFFALSNNLVSPGDLAVVSLKSGAGSSTNYQIYTTIVTASQVTIAVKNISAGTLNEALVIQFAIIKGATA